MAMHLAGEIQLATDGLTQYSVAIENLREWKTSSLQ